MRTITLLLSAYIGKLNNAEYLNLMSRLRALIETATPEGVGLTAGEMTEFSELVDQLQARVNYTTASALTGQLDDLEKQRDSLLTFLFATINSGVSLPIAAQSEAAKALELIIRPYKNTQSLPDQQETVVINGLLADLGADSAETALATLGLTAIVAELKKINDQYAELTAQRSRDSEARAVATESAGSLRKRPKRRASPTPRRRPPSSSSPSTASYARWTASTTSARATPRPRAARPSFPAPTPARVASKLPNPSLPTRRRAARRLIRRA